MAARLLLGAVLTGDRELNRRFGQEQEVYRPAPVERDQLLASESDVDRRRYAAIGAIVETSQAIRDGLTTADRLAEKTYRSVSRRLRPVTNNRLGSLVNRRIDRYAMLGDAIVRRWVDTGRSEEQLSRALVERASIESVEGTLDYLARSPEMDELIKTQSFELVEEMVDDADDGGQGNRVFLLKWIRRVIFKPSKT
jgi:hypothetical protein